MTIFSPLWFSAIFFALLRHSFRAHALTYTPSLTAMRCFALRASLDPGFQGVFQSPSSFTGTTAYWENYNCGTLASSTVYYANAVYMGCHADGSARDLNYTITTASGQTHVTLQYCMKQCFAAGFDFFGLQSAGQCRCGNDFGSYNTSTQPTDNSTVKGAFSNLTVPLPDNNCFRSCPGSSDKVCGSDWANAIYRTRPSGYPSSTYLGCYQDQGNRDLTTVVPSSSSFGVMNMCYTYCKKNGYQYVGAQFGHQCFCGNNFGSYGPLPYTSCNAGSDFFSKVFAQDVPFGGKYANSVYDTARLPLRGALPLGCWGDGWGGEWGYQPLTAASKRLTTTTELCNQLCFGKGYAYAGIALGSCRCNHDYGSYQLLPNSYCSSGCPDNAFPCGGENYLFAKSLFSVNVTNHLYLGCFADSAALRSSASRDFPFYAQTDISDNQFSASPAVIFGVHACVDFCAKLGYAYAAIQTGTECFCGNSYGSGGASTDCSGAEINWGGEVGPNGGSWANSVYDTKKLILGAGILYLGCYADSATSPELNFTAGTATNAQDCILKCQAASSAYLYAGLQGGGQCLCGSSYGAFGDLSDASCPKVCSDGSYPCGGEGGKVSSIYNITYAAQARSSSPLLFLPSPPSYSAPLPPLYVGCYKDGPVRALPFNSAPVYSAKQCVAACLGMGYVYSGLEFHECYCGNSKRPDADRLPSSSCNQKSADGSGPSGGNWALSVYHNRYMTTQGPSELGNDKAYFGCYGAGDMSRFQNVDPITGKIAPTVKTVQECLSFCESSTSPFAAITGGSSCSCAYAFIPTSPLPNSACNLRLGGLPTGGSDAYSIYNAQLGIDPSIQCWPEPPKN